MGMDKLDIWKKVIFSIPDTREILAAIIILGTIYSFLTYLGSRMFTSLSLEVLFIPLLAIFVYVLPSIFQGEILHRFIPDYPRNWGYFLALCTQFILFIYGMIMTGADNFVSAWNIMWLTMITLYLTNLTVLLLTVGYSYFRRVAALSMVQPVGVFTAFYLSVGLRLEIPLLTYAGNFGMIIVAALLVIGSFLITEYLIRVNVPNVSVLGLTSSLLQKNQEKMDLGEPAEPEVQSLLIKNQGNSSLISIPWIHPGPLEGFGGARITTRIIEDLNQDDEGFFFHVPSTHRSDPAEPDAYRKILDAMDEPETTREASKMIRKEYEEIIFYGRRLGEQKIIFMEVPDDENFDDYQISVFKEIIDLENTVLVDLHNHEKVLQGSREEVWYNTTTAERLRDYLRDFISELEEEELYSYRAGFHTDSSDKMNYSLAEEVDGQKTLLFGLEGNEAGPEIRDLERKYEEKFDMVLSFTTDTHRSIHELSKEKQIEKDKLEKTITRSRENISDAEIGLTVNRSEELNLLQEDYSGLIYSVNIMVRLIPLTLLFIYIALIIWVF